MALRRGPRALRPSRWRHADWTRGTAQRGGRSQRAAAGASALRAEVAASIAERCATRRRTVERLARLATEGLVIRAASGMARHRDPVEAALEASLSAEEHLAAERVDACLVFSTAR